MTFIMRARRGLGYDTDSSQTNHPWYGHELIWLCIRSQLSAFQRQRRTDCTRTIEDRRILQCSIVSKWRSNCIVVYTCEPIISRNSVTLRSNVLFIEISVSCSWLWFALGKDLLFWKLLSAQMAVTLLCDCFSRFHHVVYIHNSKRLHVFVNFLFLQLYAGNYGELVLEFSYTVGTLTMQLFTCNIIN